MGKNRHFLLLLIVSLAVLIAGCNTSDQEATEATATEQDTGETEEATAADDTEAATTEQAADTEQAATPDTETRDETKLDDRDMVNLEERVLQKSPAEDAAIVNELAGFQTFQNESLTGRYSMPEGLVIRESYIEDGKVHIPASGLYYTIRLSNYNTNPFGENVLYTLGKKYHWVDFGFNQDVLADASYNEVGDRVQFGDGSKSLELTGISANSPGFPAPVATFSILKPSGNYYGSTFQVSTDDKMINANEGVINDGSGKDSGTYAAGPDGRSWTQEYYGSSVAAGGASYLVADTIAQDDITVKEFATGAVDFMLFTEQEPVKMTLGADETETLGDWEVQVVDVGTDTATVKLVNAQSGEEVEKELGPMNAENTSRIPADQNQRSKFVLRTEDNAVQVQMDLYNDPFGEADKVKLVGFHDIIEMGNGVSFPEDDRFIYRPDT